MLMQRYHQYNNAMYPKMFGDYVKHVEAQSEIGRLKLELALEKSRSRILDYALSRIEHGSVHSDSFQNVASQAREESKRIK